MDDSNKFLQTVQGAIAVKGIPKKQLARRCKLSKPRFSEILHGDVKMPAEVKKKLIAELELQPVMEKMGL